MTQKNSLLTLIIVALVSGLYLNALGWLGNAVILQADWKAAAGQIGQALDLPWPALVRELLTLVSDFVYAFALVWIYAALVPGHRAPVRLALELIVLVWLTTVGMTYLALVNSGFLPVGIAWKTSLWALVTFLPLAMFLPLVLRERSEAPGVPAGGR